MKQRLRVMLIILISALLTGCSSYAPFVRLEQRIIIQITGIDLNEGVYTVSFQFSMGKSSDSGVNQNDIKTIKGSGVNIYTAIKQAKATAGKDLFFAQNQVLILGEGVMENAAVSTIEGYLKYCDKNPTVLVAGTYGKAEDLVSAKYKDEFSDKNKLKLILENADSIGIFPGLLIYEVLMSAYNQSNACFIPMLKLTEAEADNSEDGSNGGAGDSKGGDSSNGGGGDDDSEEEIIPDGGALIIGGKFVASLDSEACSGLSLLTNKMNTSSATFLSEGKPYTVEIYKIKTKIKPLYDGENLTFNITLSANAEVSRNTIMLDSFESITPSNSVLKKLTEETLKSKLRDTVKNTVELGGDVFMLEEHLKHYDCSSWLKLEDEWTEKLKEIKFNYSVTIKII